MHHPSACLAFRLHLHLRLVAARAAGAVPRCHPVAVCAPLTSGAPPRQIPFPLSLHPPRRLLCRAAHHHRAQAAARVVGLPLPRAHSGRLALRPAQPLHGFVQVCVRARAGVCVCVCKGTCRCVCVCKGTCSRVWGLAGGGGGETGASAAGQPCLTPCSPRKSPPPALIVLASFVES